MKIKRLNLNGSTKYLSSKISLISLQNIAKHYSVRFIWIIYPIYVEIVFNICEIQLCLGITLPLRVQNVSEHVTGHARFTFHMAY